MKQYLLFVAGALCLGMTMITTTSAQTPNTVYGCYKKNEGQLRRVDSLTDCKKNEIPITWNVQGSKGDKGDPGPSGSQGNIGPEGPPGSVSSPYTFKIFTNTTTFVDGEIEQTAKATCGEGYIRVSLLELSPSDFPEGVQVLGPFISPFDNTMGWRFIAPFRVQVTIRILCVQGVPSADQGAGQ